MRDFSKLTFLIFPFFSDKLLFFHGVLIIRRSPIIVVPFHSSFSAAFFQYNLLPSLNYSSIFCFFPFISDNLKTCIPLAACLFWFSVFASVRQVMFSGVDRSRQIFLLKKKAFEKISIKSCFKISPFLIFEQEG